jgi:hypothetical protein
MAMWAESEFRTDLPTGSLNWQGGHPLPEFFVDLGIFPIDSKMRRATTFRFVCSFFKILLRRVANCKKFKEAMSPVGGRNDARLNRLLIPNRRFQGQENNFVSQPDRSSGEAKIRRAEKLLSGKKRRKGERP